jgi:SAM-dependent methyltransferase
MTGAATSSINSSRADREKGTADMNTTEPMRVALLGDVPDSDTEPRAALVEETYWADFYRHTSIAAGSTFQAALATRADLPNHVIDLGCGDGRDSFAFARLGRTVLGIDRSAVAVTHAMEHATAHRVSTVRFATCDVGDVSALEPLLAWALRGEPALFYARFFLHSIPEQVQRTLLTTISRLARDGDQLAAEFRTLQDESRPKIYGNHYRRYQDGPAFGRRLAEDYGFAVVDEHESAGLAPYRDEDPVVYRVIARR